MNREGRAEKITELSGNPKAHMDALRRDSDTKVREVFIYSRKNVRKTLSNSTDCSNIRAVLNVDVNAVARMEGV